MLAARASTTRTVQCIARSFATAVDSAGLKVAALDNNQPTSAVTILIKAGSRYEPKPGVAHALKNFAFKVCFLWNSHIVSLRRTEHGEKVSYRNGPRS
jgi:ubiquinol-cytochrome c reductase core subunit 2